MTRTELSHVPREIVTIGGGTGSPIVNEALLRTNQVQAIDAIASVFDSGGATGRRRLDAQGQEPAYSDAMRILLSLVHPDEKDKPPFQVISEWFNHRDVRDKVLGQDIFNRFSDETTGFSRLQEQLENLGIHVLGSVLPATSQSTDISFSTSSGRQFKGEHNLDDLRMSKDVVMKMVLDPRVDAYAPAAEAIKKAKLVILSSGSFHGSVLTNFLPEGMKEALSQSQAKLFLVTNLVSTRNETHEYTPMDFVSKVEQYSGKRPDGLIVPEMTRGKFESEHSTASGLYDLEHSHFLGWEDDVLNKAVQEGIEIVTHNATKVVTVPNNSKVIRHDPTLLSETLYSILPKR